jgi:hypothetical protein
VASAIMRTMHTMRRVSLFGTFVVGRPADLLPTGPYSPGHSSHYRRLADNEPASVRNE